MEHVRVLEVEKYYFYCMFVWRAEAGSRSRRAAGCRSPRPSALSLRQPPPALMRARCPRLAPPRRAPERRCSRRLAEDWLRSPEDLPSRRASALFLYLYSPAAPPAPPSSRRARSRQPIRDVADMTRTRRGHVEAASTGLIDPRHSSISATARPPLGYISTSRPPFRLPRTWSRR